MFSCEMQVGEESTCQPEEKHQDESAADPARRQLPRPEEETQVQGTRFLQEKRSRQRGGGWQQESGSGEGRDTCFEDKLWAEDFCGEGVDFFLSPYARM